MTSPETRTHSNSHGDVLGPSEPERTTSDVIIIGEDGLESRPHDLLPRTGFDVYEQFVDFAKLDVRFMSPKELEFILSLKQSIESRKQAAIDESAALSDRQAADLVEATALSPEEAKKQDLARHFVTTVARQFSPEDHAAIERTVEKALRHAKRLGKGALNSTAELALAEKNARLAVMSEKVRTAETEMAEGKIDLALLATAVDHAFHQLLANCMGDIEAMTRVELLHRQVKASIPSEAWVTYDDADDEVLDTPTERISTGELETMTQNLTTDDVSPPRGVNLQSVINRERDEALERALALARPSSEF